MRSAKAGHKTSSVVSVMWHVEIKCYHVVSSSSIRSTWPDNNRDWLLRPLLAHFRRKMAQLCLWTKIRTKQWLVLDASAFQFTRAGFLCLKCDNFACLHTRQDQNGLHLKRRFFLPKSASSVSRSVAIFPSVVQAYTQSYSFCGRIKLIICQIRHELSVTSHENKH